MGAKTLIDDSVSITAGSFVVGVTYIIKTAGTTDFTAIGASDNNVGTDFVATGVGSGTGTATKASGVFVAEDEATIFASGLGAAEPVNILISPDNGTTYVQLLSGGNNVTLTGDDNFYQVLTPGRYKVTKANTTGTTKVFASYGVHI